MTRLRLMRDRICDDRGSMEVVAMAIIAVAMLGVGGWAVDRMAITNAQEEQTGKADAAALGAANEIDLVEYDRNGRIVLDEEAARNTARRYLVEHTDDTDTIDGWTINTTPTTVTVALNGHVERTWSRIANGLGTYEVSKSATASPVGDGFEQVSPPEFILPEDGPAVPVAAITATPTAGPAPLATTLDASASYDSDGEIVLYEWSYEGNGAVNASTETSTIPASYANGTHNASVRVTDNDGNVSGWASVALCSAGPPRAWIPRAGQTGRVPNVHSAILSAEAVIDCQGHPQAPKITTARISWGDLYGQRTQISGNWEHLRWYDNAFVYPGLRPSPYYPPGSVPWGAHGRGWRIASFQVQDSFGRWSNAPTYGFYINTLPNTWVSGHDCTPKPCSNNRLVAWMSHWGTDPEQWNVAYLYSWWHFWGNGGDVWGAAEDRNTTGHFSIERTGIHVPLYINHGSNAHDYDGEWSYRNVCNQYFHDIWHNTGNHFYVC